MFALHANHHGGSHGEERNQLQEIIAVFSSKFMSALIIQNENEHISHICESWLLTRPQRRISLGGTIVLHRCADGA